MVVGRFFSRCMCNLPVRVILSLMGFWAMINAYTMRAVLNIAITEMVHREGHNETIRDNTCAVPGGGFASDRPGFEWSEKFQGAILGSFYWGYAVTHIPGGLLSAKYGGKHVLSIGILSTAIFTILTPAVIKFGGATGLIVLRVLEGLGEGTCYPALNTLLAAWIPLSERSKASALVFGGAQFGNIFSNSISGMLMHSFDWSAPFYFFGIAGVIWFICFQLLCYSDPGSHPYISDGEKEYLMKELNQLSRRDSLPRPPWKAIFTSMPMISVIVAQICHNLGYFTVVSDLPKYFADVLKFKINENGFYSSLPYIAMWISTMVFSYISDYCISHKKLDVTKSRKLYTTLSFFFPGVFLVLASYGGCNRIVAVAFFTIAMTFMGAFYSGMKVNTLDLSPNYAGALMGITNGIGALAGIAAPNIVGMLTPNRTLKEWRVVFYVIFAVLTLSNVFYLIFASGNIQKWNDPRKRTEETENKSTALQN